MKRAPAPGMKGSSRGVRAHTGRPHSYCLPPVNVSPQGRTYQALLQACCPALYFHPEEQHYPIAVDAFLEGMQIMYYGQPVADASPHHMARYAEPHYYLSWKDHADFAAYTKPGQPLAHGTRCDAPVYTHVVEENDMLYLTYAFFYAYQGPLSFFTRLHQPHAAHPEEHHWSFTWPHFGEHVGDWEHVTVEVDLKKHIITSVFFSAHGRGRWFDADTLCFEGGSHVIVQAALNSHACYPAPLHPTPGRGLYYPLHDFSSQALDLANTLAFIWSGGSYFFKTIQAIDLVAQSNTIWCPWAIDGGLIALDTQPWLSFQGSWSPDIIVGFETLGITREAVDLIHATGASLSRTVWLPLETPPAAPVGYAHEALHEVATTPRFLAELPIPLLHTPGPKGPRQQRWWSTPEPEARLLKQGAPTIPLSSQPQAPLANL